MCRGDVGIAPTPTDRWTLGKCGFKIVQYMAAGLPVIASPVGANAELVVPGGTGLLPRPPPTGPTPWRPSRPTPPSARKWAPPPAGGR